MKKKLLSLFSLALLVASSAWAQETYQIGTAEELEAFALKVNEGEINANAVLTADIDYSSCAEMIGTVSGPYAGTFEGQGHRITIGFSTSENYAGLFRYFGGTIKNLIVDGTLSTSAQFAAGVAGYVVAGSVIENCVCSVDIISSVVGDGSHGGIASLSFGLTLKNSIYTGTIDGPETNACGGLVSGGYIDMINCVMGGKMNIAEGGGTDVFGRAGATLTNCYYLPNIGSVGAGAVMVSEEQIASGEVCYLLNGNQSDIVWYQTIGEDAYPVPFSDGHSQVYANGALNCDGTSKDGAVAYSNSQTSTVPDHEFQDGFCINCGAEEPGFSVEEKDGYYQVDTAGKLRWIARRVSEGNTGICVCLTADIDYSSCVEMIGTDNRPYAGTFEGQGHKITIGFSTSENYAGLFRYLGGTIKNLIVDGTLSTSAQFAAGVAGYVVAGSVIENCVCSVDIISSVVGDGSHGGIASLSFGLTLKNSIYTGTIDGPETNACGGLVSGGYIDMINCVMGGKMNIAEGGGTDVFGRAGATLTNCYYLPNIGSVGAGAVMVSEEQIASGEICYLLNGKSILDPSWYQTLGEDAYPVPFNTHGIVYEVGDNSYMSFQNLEDLQKQIPITEKSLLQEMVAFSELKSSCMTALNEMESIADTEEFMEAYKTYCEGLKQEILLSEVAYKAYMDKVAEVTVLLEEHPESQCKERDLLESYLNNNDEPNEDYEFGTYEYIIEHMNLSTEEITNETAKVQGMFDEAMARGFVAGSDITLLLKNADLKDGFNSWEGSLPSGLGSCEVSPYMAAECWNRAFDMHQTISDLKDGFYMVTLNASTRPGCNTSLQGNFYSTNYSGALYLNDNLVYLPVVSETYMPIADAQDGINCNLSYGAALDSAIPFYAEDGETLIGYGMAGVESMAIAANAGRGAVCLIAKVTDGNLTIGIKNPGNGFPYNWTGFANIRLTYVGQMEEASESMDRVLENQSARANTLLASQFSDGWDYAEFPNFSQELKDELSAEIAEASQAETAEAKYALIERFSETFKNIFDCKRAYIAMLNEAENLNAVIADAANAGMAEQSDIDNATAAVKWAWDGYCDGSITLEEALAMKPLKECSFAPSFDENGVYQINNMVQFLLFMNGINSGIYVNTDADLNCDIPNVTEDNITTANIYAGKFNGNFHTINLNINRNVDNCSLFYALQGTVCNLILRGTLTCSGKFAGPLATHTYAGTVISCVSSYVDIISNTVGDGTHGGLTALANGATTFENCLVAGNLMGSETHSCAGFVGGGTVTYYNCLLVSDIQWNPTNGCTFSRGGATTGSNYFYLNQYGEAQGTQITNEQLLCGEVAFMLNQNENDGIWHQNIGEDPFPVPDPSHKSVYLTEDGTYGNETAILGISQENKGQKGIFNLQGQRVEKATKGIYIMDGKKTLVK